MVIPPLQLYSCLFLSAPAISSTTAQEWAASPCYMHWNSDLCRRLLTPLSCPTYSTLHVFAREICEWFFVRVSSYIQWFSVVLEIRKWNETPWRVSLQTSGFWDRGEGHMEKRQEPQWPQCCSRHWLLPLAEPASQCIFIWPASGLGMLLYESLCPLGLTRISKRADFLKVALLFFHWRDTFPMYSVSELRDLKKIWIF